MFTRLLLDVGNVFTELSDATKFEDVCPGRVGAVIVQETTEGAVPIVRTTTQYMQPAQRFATIHYLLMETIRKTPDIQFNNAMVEIYTPEYHKMGFHTDQTLDIEDNSYIAIFSCYENATVEEDVRVLKVENKLTKACSEIRMEHNSVILFSTGENRLHRHKIVL